MTNNSSTLDNPVGRFMVAAGAVIVNPEGKILLLRRSDDLDWQPGEWELMYGRLAQFEDPTEGLMREVMEEAGLTIEVEKPLTIWHIYRGGEKKPENDLIGITFLCRSTSTNVNISPEHSESRWVTPDQALQLVKVDGILRDIQAYIDSQE